MRLSTFVALAAALMLSTAAHALDFERLADLDRSVPGKTEFGSRQHTEDRANAESCDLLGVISAEVATLSPDEVEAALDARNFVKSNVGAEVVAVADLSTDSADSTGPLGQPVSPSDALVSFDSELLP